MSIEKNIETMVHLLERIAASVESLAGMPVVDQQVPNILQPQAPGNIIPDPVPNPAPPVAEPAPVVPPASQMLQAPFTDSQGFIAYVMDKYKTLGPERGAGIQSAMIDMGYGNVNEVAPEHYNQLYTAIEGIQ